MRLRIGALFTRAGGCTSMRCDGRRETSIVLSGRTRLTLQSKSSPVADALVMARSSVAGATSLRTGHGLLATLLLRVGRRAEAEAVVVQASGLGSGTGDAYDALAHVSLMLGQHERANSLYRKAVQVSPADARFHYNLASSERSFGRLKDAEAACNRAIALDPLRPASYLLRSELMIQTSERNHIEELRGQLARPDLDDRARTTLGYALAKELDDLNRYEEAFHWFAAAAAARRRKLSYDVGVDENKLARITEAFSGQIVRATATPEGSQRFVFIIGLPRSGTTLVERILSGHAGVFSNGETDNFMRALLACTPAGAGDIFARAATADSTCVGSRYVSLADPRAGSVGAGSDLVIEKLPMNYLYVGAIHRALPEARLIWVRRSPLDSCFAMFRSLFGGAYPFSYDLEELARYYAAYTKLMAHWRAVLDARLHEVVYEELVAEPGRVGADVARYCGLSWNPAALAVERNRSVSLTASAAQVRRPIYGTSSNRWRHYRTQLQPLVEALRRHGVDLPTDV